MHKETQYKMSSCVHRDLFHGKVYIISNMINTCSSEIIETVVYIPKSRIMYETS